MLMTEEDKVLGKSALTKSEMEADGLLAKAEEFSILSASIAKILSDISMEMKKALEQFHTIQSVIELKKKELTLLHDVDVSAVSLQQLIEDHQLQRENLELLMNSRRASWEEEKARLDREEKEYQDNLKNQRQREEEEYRRIWASEQLKAQQSIEEDLIAAKQTCQQMQETMERDYLEREHILGEREMECSRIIQELEQFTRKLGTHAKSQNPF
jgi:hypothetical protein